MISELLANTQRSSTRPTPKKKPTAASIAEPSIVDSPKKQTKVEPSVSQIAEPEPEQKVDNKTDVENIDLESITAKWPDVLEKIGLINFKIAHFLAGSEIIAYTGNQISIQLNNENGFTVRSLEKDKPSIENILSEVLGTSVRIKFKSNPLKVKKDDSKPLEMEQDHPLMLDVIEKFNGEIIR